MILICLISCHKAQEEYKPEEADLFLRMDVLKDSDGTLSTPFRPCGFAAMWSLLRSFKFGLFSILPLVVGSLTFMFLFLQMVRVPWFSTSQIQRWILHLKVLNTSPKTVMGWHRAFTGSVFLNKQKGTEQNNKIRYRNFIADKQMKFYFFLILIFVGKIKILVKWVYIDSILTRTQFW